jgi:hypothetical protein
LVVRVSALPVLSAFPNRKRDFQIWRERLRGLSLSISRRSVRQRSGIRLRHRLPRLDAWNFARRRGLLIRNPWATAPLPSFDLGVDDFQLKEGRYRIAAGQSMGEIFGLPDGWPEA